MKYVVGVPFLLINGEFTVVLGALSVLVTESFEVAVLVDRTTVEPVDIGAATVVVGNPDVKSVVVLVCSVFNSVVSILLPVVC